MTNVRVARRYALALMDAAEGKQSIEEVTQDLATIGAVLRASREFRTFLSSPIVSPKKKWAVLTEMFGTRVGRDAMDFMELLVTKSREAVLADAIEQFNALRDEKLGIVNVSVTTAIAVTAQQERTLQHQLEDYTRKKVRVRWSLDAAIKGGLLVRIGDTVLDASIRHQLELLAERFLEGDPLTNSI